MAKHKHEPKEDQAEVTSEVVAAETPLEEAITAAETTQAAEKGEAIDGAAKVEKVSRPVPREAKYAETSIIKILNDKDGKPYGAENNPKKLGSASYDRFARYVDGATVKDALAAGLLRGDIDNDVKKGYISIV